jgi:uncharacterized iron-regulated protein
MSPFGDRPRLQLASSSPQAASSARLEDFGSSQIRALPTYPESAGTAAVPSGNGQRLGQSNVKDNANAAIQKFEQDRTAIKRFEYAIDALQFIGNPSREESDTPRRAGGLMSWAASKAVGSVV